MRSGPGFLNVQITAETSHGPVNEAADGTRAQGKSFGSELKWDRMTLERKSQSYNPSVVLSMVLRSAEYLWENTIEKQE